MRMIVTAMMMAFVMMSGTAYANDKINLNTANAEQLQGVKGIGEKTAAAIVTYRKAHGDFKSVNDLTNVKGIGEKKLSKIEGNFEVSRSKKDKKKHDKKKSDQHDS
ncbi:MAG: helix-hairpin-helix domain-containing protein [Mariprofundaceae bacterium]|nr:helix-hairpin-helix domain-containing protein [Mariprofundaceae bacterium]